MCYVTLSALATTGTRRQMTSANAVVLDNVLQVNAGGSRQPLRSKAGLSHVRKQGGHSLKHLRKHGQEVCSLHAGSRLALLLT